ncbi:MAG: hypothetical protein ABI779_16195 [Acidobacteriota bacterium]
MTVLHGSDGPPVELTPELEAELNGSIAEIERGEWVDGDDFLRELRRRRSSSVEVCINSADAMRLTVEELDDLDKAIGEADRGEGVSADEVLRELRLMRETESAHRR